MPITMKAIIVVLNLSVLYYLSPIFSHPSEATVDMRVICLIFTSIGLGSFFIGVLKFINKNIKVRGDI